MYCICLTDDSMLVDLVTSIFIVMDATALEFDFFRTNYVTLAIEIFSNSYPVWRYMWPKLFDTIVKQSYSVFA